MTIVSLAAVVWNFPLVGRTRMLTEAWMAAGRDTVFVQIPSYRTALERLTIFARPRDAVEVVRPWPTTPARRWSNLTADELNSRIARKAKALRRDLAKKLSFETSTAVVVSPVWTPWIRELPFRHVVYDCIDALDVHVPRPELSALFRQWEDELVQRIDAAVVTAEDLGADLARRRPGLPVRTIRNGVDVDAFQRTVRSTPRPVDAPHNGRPIVGFVGALYHWIDWSLIDKVTRELSDFDFFFVGPDDGNPAIKSLHERPNVHFLGPRPFVQVPAYMQAFDVCWVPFTQDHISTAANPVKIYEYLALGKPVVSTPVADPHHFADLIDVGASPAAIAGALRSASAPTARTSELQGRRIAFARRNTWRARADEYADFIASLG